MDKLVCLASELNDNEEVIKVNEVKALLDLIRSTVDRQMQCLDEVRNESKRSVLKRLVTIKELCAMVK